MHGCCLFAFVAGVADPTDDRDELAVVAADACECSWFVGFATSPGAWCGVVRLVSPREADELVLHS